MQQSNNMIKTIGKYSYYTQKCLGQGSFGKVFEGFDNNTKDKVAIKKVDYKTLEKDAYLGKAIDDQIKILNKFKHPNIVQLFEVLRSKRSLYIIMQYCKNGDLKKYLRTRKRLNDSQAFTVMKQIIIGYQQLARQKTIHRDLKPANILINENLFKICDFGFSKVIKDPTTALKTCVGSPIYMAPQILEKKNYSAKCDIWSLGVIYYQILHGVVPWSARSEKQLIGKIKSQSIKMNNCSVNTQKIICKMLEINEDRRASLCDLEVFFNIEQINTTNNNNFKNMMEGVSLPQQTSALNNINNQQSITDDKVNNHNNGNLNTKQMRSVTTIQTKVINRSYFEQLSWRYFVAIEIRIQLFRLNRYNFKKNMFQRYLVLIIASIECNLKRRLPEIQAIHQRQAKAQIMKEYEIYNSFRKDLYCYLDSNFSTCQILKQFQFTDIANSNYTQQVIKRSQRQIIRISRAILTQIKQELKNNKQIYQQYKILQYIQQLILDMILLNQKQNKTGNSQLIYFFIDRDNKLIEKRIFQKLSLVCQVNSTQFF